MFPPSMKITFVSKPPSSRGIWAFTERKSDNGRIVGRPYRVAKSPSAKPGNSLSMLGMPNDSSF